MLASHILKASPAPGSLLDEDSLPADAETVS
jgi:hypothetical protein